MFKNLPQSSFASRSLFFQPTNGFLLVAVLLLGGCSLGHQKGSVVPGTAISQTSDKGASEKSPVFYVHGEYYVERLPEDGRGINRLIVDDLRKRGLRAATGQPGLVPNETNVIITYQDRWMWDMSMYMIRLNIQLKTTDGDLLASGESYRTSMIRKSPEFMIGEILNEIFEEVDPALVMPEEEKETKTMRKTKYGGNQTNDEYRL